MKKYNQIILFVVVSSLIRDSAKSAIYVLDDFTSRLAKHLGVSEESITPQKSFINNSGTIAGHVFIEGEGGRSYLWKPGKGFIDVPNQINPTSGSGDLFVPSINSINGLSSSGAVIGTYGDNTYLMYPSGNINILKDAFGASLYPIDIDSNNNVLAIQNGDESYRYGIWSQNHNNLLAGQSISYYDDPQYVPYALSGEVVELWKVSYGEWSGSTIASQRFFNQEINLGIEDNLNLPASLLSGAQLYPVSANDDGTILANMYELTEGVFFAPNNNDEYPRLLHQQMQEWNDVKYTRPILIDPHGGVIELAMPESAENSWVVPKSMSSKASYIIGQMYDKQSLSSVPVVWENNKLQGNSGLQIDDRLQDVNEFGAIVFNRPAEVSSSDLQNGDSILVRYKVHPLLGDIDTPYNADVLAVFDSAGHHTLDPYQEITGKNVYILTHGWARGIREQIIDDPAPKIWDYTDVWYQQMSESIRSKDPLAVVVGYSWIGGSATYTNIDAYNSRVNADMYGIRLAELLSEYDLANPMSINLIGYSHGSVVTMVAGTILESSGIDIKSIVLLDPPERSLTLDGGLTVIAGGAARLNDSLNRFAYQFGVGESVGQTRIINVSTRFGIPYQVDGVINLAPAIPTDLDINAHSYAYVWYGQQVANSDSVFDRWWLGDDAPRITPYQGQIEKVVARYVDEDFLWASTMVFDQEQEILFVPFDMSEEYGIFDRIILTLSYESSINDGLIGIWIDENPFLIESIMSDDVYSRNYFDIDVTGIENGLHSVSILLHDGEGKTAYDKIGDIELIVSGVNEIPNSVPDVSVSSLLCFGAVLLLSRRKRSTNVIT